MKVSIFKKAIPLRDAALRFLLASPREIEREIKRLTRDNAQLAAKIEALRKIRDETE